MSGHGHVKLNPDGSRTRCGGPGICDVCSMEAVREWKTMRAERDDWQARYLDMHKRGTWKNAQEYSEYWRIYAEHEETRRRKAEEKCNVLQAERAALRAALAELMKRFEGIL